jgi:hypothetical protein
MYCRESYIKLSQHPAHKMLEISSGNEGNSVKSFMLLYVDNTFDKKYHFGGLKCKLFEITTFWTFPLLEKCQRQISLPDIQRNNNVAVVTPLNSYLEYGRGILQREN